MSPARHPGGRPRDKDNPAKRATQFRLAYLVLSKYISFDEGLILGKVNARTFNGWISQFKTSSEQMAVDLRKELREN